MNDLTPLNQPLSLTNCDREPIHIPGGIQPLGFLLALSADWLITRAANTAPFLGEDPLALLGRPLSDVFTEDAFATLRSKIANLRGDDAIERVFALPLFGDGSLYDMAVHFSGKSVIVECEPAKEDQTEVSSATRGVLGKLGDAKSVQALLNEGARQFRALVGYDRVMLYRFAPDGSGEVVAQSKADGQDSFLGLHFPATDIPEQARKLYVRNTFRIIADAHAEPIPVEKVGEGQPLDLSMALYRAVSPVHLEYLRNMGVRASLSVSIIVDGKFWGLIACHHASPRVPSFAARSAAELFGQIFSLQLESRLRAEASAKEDTARHVSNRLMTAAAKDSSKLLDADWLLELMPRAIGCDGVGVMVEGVTSLAGLTPSEDEFLELVKALNREDAQTIHHSAKISGFVPAIDPDRSAVAGFLAIPISRRPRDHMILFRKEQVESIRWAGDQEKTAEHGEFGTRLTPRESFAEFRELVRGQSAPFTEAEVRVAEALRTTLLEVVLHLTDAASEEQRKAGDQQKLLIAELNHRVRNILALIRALMSQSRREGGNLDAVIDTLESRVKALANAHDLLTADNWGPIAFTKLMKTELEAYLDNEQRRVVLEGPEVSILPEAIPILALVMHEMATNAAKYGALSDSGKLRIEWSLLANNDLSFTWKEQGGPAVKAPTRKGFGTTIIGTSIPHELGGEAEISYKPGGVEATFVVPAKFVEEQAAAHNPAAKDKAHPTPQQVALNDCHMLLVEDSMLIAIDAEDKIRDLGVAEVSLAASTHSALAAIEEGDISVAMLDYNLGQETSLPIAERLAERGIPFFFASGYGSRDIIPPEFGNLPLVVKPYTAEQIEQALTTVLS